MMLSTEIASDSALIVYLGTHPSPQVSARVQWICQQLPPLMGDRLRDLIPSYASVLIVFDPLRTSHEQVRQWLHQIDSPPGNSTGEGRLVELPVYYSEESGPDLLPLARRAGLSPEQVIELHQAPEYRVYAIGFAPGFAYLGDVDERLATPRHPTPRAHVPRGAVAIADRQTAVYPAASPGGWNLIGLCPTPMFTPTTDPIMPLTVGDRVRFMAISRSDFLELNGDALAAASALPTAESHRR